MFFGNVNIRLPRKGVIFIPLILALLLIFAAVRMMAADSGETAVPARAPQAGAVYSGTVGTEIPRVITPTQEFGINGVVTTYTIYMPLLFNPMNISATRPNSANQWTISWDAVPDATGYVIQESNDQNFATLTSDVSLGNVTTNQYTKALTFNNVFYYRVKPVFSTYEGQWSNSVRVIGGYRDDFSDDTSGWSPVRRTTYLEETVAYYGSGSEAGNLIVIVADRWDWLIASPLKPAPVPPYAIQFRTRVHEASNLISGGPVFGGDWNGGACPEIGNVYQTTNCFNHFYNFNMIFYGPMKLLHEQVDSLVWCPNCGGSPIKRIGPTQGIDPILSNGPSKEWHEYRIEVRATGVTFFVDNVQKGFFSNTTYINEPYFGVFASTDEYKPSIWFYDYYQIAPLD